MAKPQGPNQDIFTITLKKTKTPFKENKKSASILQFLKAFAENVTEDSDFYVILWTDVFTMTAMATEITMHSQ